METTNLIIIGLHLLPLIYIVQLIPAFSILKLMTSVTMMLTLYVTSLIISTNNTDSLKVSVIKSGFFLTKASLTLNDLRTIKFKNLFGTGKSNKNPSLADNNRKIMLQELQEVKESNECMTRSSSHRFNNENSPVKIKKTDSVHDVNAIDQMISSGSSSNKSASARKGSFKLNHSQDAGSLLIIVVKKNRKQ